MPQSSSTLKQVGMPSSNHEVIDFDMYLLSLSWTPSFCCNKKKAKQCDQQGLRGTSKLTLHGLWPTYKSPRNGKSFPSFCSPSTPESGKRHKSLETHEWNKHGTCTGLDPHAYLVETSLQANSKPKKFLEEILLLHMGTFLSLSTLQSALPLHSLLVSASPLCQLKELTICLSRTEDGRVDNIIPCPAHIRDSSRNSASGYGCRSVIVDNGERCQYVSKFLKDALKGGVKEG